MGDGLDGRLLGIAVSRAPFVYTRDRTAGGRTLRPASQRVENQPAAAFSVFLRVSGAAGCRAVPAVLAGVLEHPSAIGSVGKTWGGHLAAGDFGRGRCRSAAQRVQ